MVARRTSKCLSLYGFFGLTSSYRIKLFSQIHDIVFHGKGGYDWHTVYNMPIWLRKFTFNKIQDYYTQQAEESSTPDKQVKSESKSNKIKRPTYSTKASK